LARVLSALVLVPLVLAGIWLAPRELLVAILCGVLLLGFVEYAKLAAASGLDIAKGVAGTAALATCVAFALPDGPVAVALVAVFAAIGVVAVGRWQPGPNVLGSVAGTLFPSLYLGLPLGLMASIRSDYGREGLLLMLVTVWVSDSAQYYSGRMFGRHLLSPTISPKKTVEGAVGGFVFGAAFFTIVGHWWLPGVPTLWLAGLGLVLVGLGIAGDLFESLLKRSAGVKDSSTLIPGHGGVLDRIDALLFVAPGYSLILRLIN
jgi:phosphatidate cytidylyltransferase